MNEYPQLRIKNLLGQTIHCYQLHFTIGKTGAETLSLAWSQNRQLNENAGVFGIQSFLRPHFSLNAPEKKGCLLMLWLGHWVGLIGEHLPNCSCLCSSCFIALLYFHHSVSMGYFVSPGILSLLLCGFLTSTCFKIPCRTLSKNVRPGGVTADTSSVTQLIWIAAHAGFSPFSKSPSPCHGFLVSNQWFSTRGDFAPPPRGYLAVSWDIFGCCNWEMLLISDQ